MIHFLGFIFFFVLIIFVIGMVILAKIVRTISQAGRRMKDAATSAGKSTSRTQSGASTQHTPEEPNPSTTSRKKIFDSDEGEYVEFEEIK